MQRISRSVRTITGIALASALAAPAAAGEKSAKPRIAVIEFKNQSHGQFEIESSQWGEWVADVERPRAAGHGGGANAMSMDDTAGKKAAAPTAIAHDLRTNVIARTAPGSGGDPDRPIIAGKVPNASATSVGAAQSLTVGGARSYSAPLQRGSVVLRLKQPWAGCAAGDRFDGVFVMTGATHGYRLGGAEVARCDGRAVTINYTMFAAQGTPTD